jgi:hypothetical protein
MSESDAVKVLRRSGKLNRATAAAIASTVALLKRQGIRPNLPTRAQVRAAARQAMLASGVKPPGIRNRKVR